MTTAFAPLVPAASGPARTVWTSVAEGLWAGNRDGEFLGTVEFVDGGFETADHRGARIGRSHSLAAAERLIDEPSTPENVLVWRDERTLLTAGWLGFATLAVAAVAIALQLVN